MSASTTWLTVRAVRGGGRWAGKAGARELHPPSPPPPPPTPPHPPLPLPPRYADLEWQLTYVGSAESEKYDQVLDTVYVGPVAPGQYRFVFQVRVWGRVVVWVGCDRVIGWAGGTG